MRIIITFTTILLFLVLVTVYPAVAGESVQIFEMGESGQTVEFKLSPEEIAAKMNETKRLATSTQNISGTGKQRETIFEMAESGQLVSFPMTEKEIVAEDAQKAQSRVVQNRRANKDGTRRVIFELAESGVTIEFPEKMVEILVNDVALINVNVE